MDQESPRDPDEERGHACPVCGSDDSYAFGIETDDVDEPVRELLTTLTVSAEIARCNECGNLYDPEQTTEDDTDGT